MSDLRLYETLYARTKLLAFAVIQCTEVCSLDFFNICNQILLSFQMFGRFSRAVRFILVRIVFTMVVDEFDVSIGPFI